MGTKIEWATESWNPVTGCTPVSEGCENCYAERFALRLASRAGYPARPHHFDVTLHPDRLEQPLKWRKPRRIFVCSMGDLFHEDVDAVWVDFVLTIAALADQHQYLILTKRPERMRDYFSASYGEFCQRLNEASRLIHGTDTAPVIMPTQKHGMVPGKPWPLKNVWLGVTAENQARADERIPVLLSIPAAVHFVSIEPMLGPVDLTQIGSMKGESLSALETIIGLAYERPPLDWIIVGGETGPGARPVHPAWVRDVRDQCWAANVPFFFKQWGEWTRIISGGVGTCKLYDTGQNTIARGDWRFAQFMGDKWSYGVTETNMAEKVILAKVGKKLAGRELDGREWNEYPNERR